MVSKGSLELPLNIQLLNNEGEVALSWGDNSGVGNASDTDFAMPLVYNANKRVAIYDMVSSCRGDEGVSLSYPSIAWYRESYLYQSVDVISADWFFLRLELDRNLIGTWQEDDRKMVGRRFILCNLKLKVENWKIWVSGLGTELVRRRCGACL